MKRAGIENLFLKTLIIGFGFVSNKSEWAYVTNRKLLSYIAGFNCLQYFIKIAKEFSKSNFYNQYFDFELQ